MIPQFKITVQQNNVTSKAAEGQHNDGGKQHALICSFGSQVPQTSSGWQKAKHTSRKRIRPLEK